MDKLTIEYATYSKALPPQPMNAPADFGVPAFARASTYGLELLYQYETPCHVVNDKGPLRFEWDWANEPGGGLTGGEFVPFAPRLAPRFYLFNTRLDVQAPPGHVIRSAPHPRYFTDGSGTVPLAMIGHMQTEWYPRLYFVVFRAPRPGQRHIFRKGEPFAQIIFVPMRRSYETVPVTIEEMKN
jgi:hypothetical protein